eukprot:TRINITY_DN10661_c0_g1_i11.p1 TRINITY_DN10661_c0_g1~~TRINITY_DN10661_c0_g1_i11.p1  ORF type:complete len:263 (-),score=80.15 TRINITY_DN10661_c0_g1_i11:154-942(-)
MAEPVKRKTLIVGNWKCNCDLAFIRDFINNSLNKVVINTSILEVMIAPPMIHIPAVKALLTSPISVMAQNVSACPKGSYTGEVNAESLKDFGIDWVLLGHSERREIFQDTAEKILMKLDEAHKQNMNVLLCIPDRLDEKDFTKSWTLMEKKLEFVRDKNVDWKRIALVYEPVPGVAAKRAVTAETVNDACEKIRTWLQEKVEGGEEVRVLFAGAITETNCKLYLAQPHIDGFLLGKESLLPVFAQIVKITNDAKGDPDASPK